MLLRNLVTKRSIHTVPKLPSIHQLETTGIPKVYSPTGFKTVWSDYQAFLCDKLTLKTAGTSYEANIPFHIILSTAKKPYQTQLFNLASAVHNNHLFIENILPVSGSDNRPSQTFLSRVRDSFDVEWEELKENIVRLTERKVIGQGWFFLIENGNKELHCLTLQNNGTPYYFPRNQLFDLNAPVNLSEFSHLEQIREMVVSGNGSPHSESPQQQHVIRDWSMPLICVNLWDYAYLPDYGVTGRSTYVRNVLDNLNWNVVNSRLYK